MEYTIDELNIPDIYSTDDINEFKNYESNIRKIEITLRPYETYYNSNFYNTYAYLITNNTKLYIVYDSKLSRVCDDRYTRNIYNKMYLCLNYTISIENYSDEIAYLKIFIIPCIPMIKHAPIFMIELMSVFYPIGTFIDITENIVIRTKEKINITYKYFDTPNMILCYKIKNVRDDIYELKLCKITNKINNKSIIIPQKNINNIYHYYSIIYDKLSGIFSEGTTDNIYRIRLSLIDGCGIFNYRSIYFDDFKMILS